MKLLFNKKQMLVAVGLLAGLLCPVGLSAQSYVPLYEETRMAVQPQVEIQAYPLPLQQVKLLDGPFKTAMEADKAWLLTLEPDRFLHRFHENAGFTPKRLPSTRDGKTPRRAVSASGITSRPCPCSTPLRATSR